MRTLFFAAMLTGGYILAQTYGPSIEGAAFPVVDTVQISRTEPVEENSTRIWGSFNRLRDCDFVTVDFFLGNTTRSARAALEFEEGSKVRGDGYADFGPWVVQLTEKQLEGNSYAVATHRCHPFWETLTQFY